MILAAHSNANQLSELGSKSHVGCHYFLTTNNATPQNNDAILTLLTIIQQVLSSASEAELSKMLYPCNSLLKKWVIIDPEPPSLLTILLHMALSQTP